MSHYFDEHQESPLHEETISFTAKNRTFTATTANGVFSKKKLDKATKLLIETATPREHDRVLDLGCGWGAVGLVLKTTTPSIELTMSDTNKRALALAKKNFSQAQLKARFVASDGFQKLADKTFDLILTNPPYAAGRAVCYQFIEESYAHLTPKGTFLLVARHQKGGAMLEQHIKTIFGKVTTLAKKSGFRVYQGIKE